MSQTLSYTLSFDPQNSGGICFSSQQHKVSSTAQLESGQLVSPQLASLCKECHLSSAEPMLPTGMSGQCHSSTQDSLPGLCSTVITDG